MLKLKNGIDKIDLIKCKNLLGETTGGMTSIFMVDILIFIELFDQMVLSVSELQDHKIKTMNLAKPIASIALSQQEMTMIQ